MQEMYILVQMTNWFTGQAGRKGKQIHRAEVTRQEINKRLQFENKRFIPARQRQVRCDMICKVC